MRVDRSEILIWIKGPSGKFSNSRNRWEINLLPNYQPLKLDETGSFQRSIRVKTEETVGIHGIVEFPFSEAPDHRRTKHQRWKLIRTIQGTEMRTQDGSLLESPQQATGRLIRRHCYRDSLWSYTWHAQRTETIHQGELVETPLVTGRKQRPANLIQMAECRMFEEIIWARPLDRPKACNRFDESTI